MHYFLPRLLATAACLTAVPAMAQTNDARSGDYAGRGRNFILSWDHRF